MRRGHWLIPAVIVVVLVAVTSAAARNGSQAKGTMAAAPFAEAWAKVPRTAAGRRAANVVVVGAEQTFNGFNTVLNCCSQLWATFAGGEETGRGAFVQNQTGDWVKELVSSASASKTGVTYTIRPDAYWYWGGKKLPVTYKDFVYTMQQIDNPNNDLQSRTGYSNLNPTKFTHKGDKQVTLFWKTTNCTSDYPCGPFANWQYLFSTAFYPSQALAGLDFNKIWTNCVCGNDGKPVTDGPYYVSNYTAGQGVTLKANPFFFTKPKVGEIDFKFITDTNSEEEAMRGGEVDLITPTFGSYLQPLKTTPGLTFDQIPGYYFEHLDIREGNAKAGPSVSKGSSNVLLRAPWMRQAIMLGIDRQSIINTVYGALAGNTKPLDSILFYSSDAGYRPDFSKWNYNPKKALATLKAHCTGGPSAPDPSNNSYWTCSGYPAEFRYTWTASNATRTTQEAIVKAQLRSIGIKVVDNSLPADVVFGPTGIPSGNYDLANFAWVTPPDPSGFVEIWGCGGESNYLDYCNRKATALLQASNSQLDPAKRRVDFQRADALMAKDVPTVPMYQRPNPLVYKSGVTGMKNNAASVGFTWNMEDWRWKS